MLLLRWYKHATQLGSYKNRYYIFTFCVANAFDNRFAVVANGFDFEVIGACHTKSVWSEQDLQTKWKIVSIMLFKEWTSLG